MDDLMLPLPGLSPVGGKLVVARFDGGCLSSDAGVLVLREIEQRLGVAERLAGCIDDPRAQAQVVIGRSRAGTLALCPPLRQANVPEQEH